MHQLLNTVLIQIFQEFEKLELPLAGLSALRRCLIFTCDSSKRGFLSSIQAFIERSTSKQLEEGVQRINSLQFNIDSKASIKQDLDSFWNESFHVFYDDIQSYLHSSATIFYQNVFINGLTLYFNKLKSSINL
jgi:hypothetical protein